VFGSAILEVVIGLAFFYSLLAVIASHIDEVIAGTLSWRASTLETGIRSMLGDGDLADQVWQHRLISGMGGKAGRAPSYVPASTFATALLDVLATGNQNGVAVESGTNRQALVSLLNSAGGDQDKARAEIANWYNATMDRVSGIYKRRIQWVTLLIAALLTVVLGVDSIAIATTVWQDQGVRAALSSSAQVNAGTSGWEDAVNALSQFNLPIGWAVIPQTPFGWLLKVSGLLLTTLAISLGASFWFDVLKRFSNPRSSGPKPQ
jgi:hypothetical protein